jgi:hypothetical protein
MRVFFYLGWVFLLLAFAGAAAETLPRAFKGGGGIFVSAFDLWYAAWPGSLIVTQIHVEKVSPALWQLLAASVLALPAWMLFGVPGGALVWFCRPHKKITRQQMEELKRQEETLLLYDKLSQEAREAGFEDDEDDQEPVHGHHDIIDAPGFNEPYIVDENGEGDGDGSEEK